MKYHSGFNVSSWRNLSHDKLKAHTERTRIKTDVLYLEDKLIPLKLVDSLYHLGPVRSKDKSYPF